MSVYQNLEEPNLSADDPSIPARGRELIRIGEIAIAKEDQVVAEKFYATDFTFHAPDGATMGRGDLLKYFASCRHAFDDLRVARQAYFTDGGNYDFARTTFSGVFNRRFDLSPVGPLEPTGANMMYRINNIFRYDEDGKLAEEWAQYDSRLFLESLGFKLKIVNS